VERLELVRQLVEWQLVERLELERFELERFELVRRTVARSEVGLMRNRSGHKWLGASWG
jgi:hypothetical protein